MKTAFLPFGVMKTAVPPLAWIAWAWIVGLAEEADIGSEATRAVRQHGFFSSIAVSDQLDMPRSEQLAMAGAGDFQTAFAACDLCSHSHGLQPLKLQVHVLEVH